MLTKQPFQLTAARRRLATSRAILAFSSLFQLTAARRRLESFLHCRKAPHPFQLTAARRRLVSALFFLVSLIMFQLTAARRRLVGGHGAHGGVYRSFNSQPPEGGWAPAIAIKPRRFPKSQKPCAANTSRTVYRSTRIKTIVKPFRRPIASLLTRMPPQAAKWP